MLAQHLRNRKNKIRSRRTFPQPPGKFHANYQRNQHGHRLSQHRSLRLNPSYTPTQHP